MIFGAIRRKSIEKKVESRKKNRIIEKDPSEEAEFDEGFMDQSMVEDLEMAYEAAMNDDDEAVLTLSRSVATKLEFSLLKPNRKKRKRGW